MANEKYEQLEKQMQFLADWRDSTDDVKKARAIQRVIEKKLPQVIPTYSYRAVGDFFDTHIRRTREEFMFLNCLRMEDWRKPFMTLVMRKLTYR